MNMANVEIALEIMGKGMGGIFVAIVVIMAAVMAAGGISGCSQRAGNSETAAAGSQTETAISQAGASSEDTGEEKGAEASAEREITDMAGRKVTVPSEIEIGRASCRERV